MPIDMEEYYKIFNHYINVDILEANPELSKVTISDVNIRTIKEEKKVAISFKENSKEFVLNKTNKNTLSSFFGDNPTTWVRKSIKLQIADVEFNGNLIKGIRIAIPETIPEKKVDIKKEEPKIEKKEEPKDDEPKEYSPNDEEAEEIFKIKYSEENIKKRGIKDDPVKETLCEICKQPKGDKDVTLLFDDGQEFIHADCIDTEIEREYVHNDNIINKATVLSDYRKSKK